MKFDKKHLPETLDDVIFADAAVKQTLEEYANNQRHKHLLLYGPKGAGKSVSAQIVLKERMGVIWETGRGDVWNARSYQDKWDNFNPILRQWDFQRSWGAHTGCSVIDEIDQFTLPMQQRLSDLTEDSEIGTVIATTNNLHLIHGPLKDRFRKVLADYPSVQQWVPRVVSVMAAEGMPVTPAQAAGLLQGFQGSGRKLNDWMEDYVLRLQRTVPQLKTPSSPAQHCAHAINGKESK
jgi:hypothetical protein